MLMKLTPGDDLPLTLGRKVVPPLPLPCVCPGPAVQWVADLRCIGDDRKHPSAPLIGATVRIRRPKAFPNFGTLEWFR